MLSVFTTACSDDKDTQKPCDLVFYADLDDDGFGDPQQTTLACEAPTGHVDNSEDCDDSSSATYPGAEETCRNEVDLNCDGEVNYLPFPTTCEVHLVEQAVLSSLDLEGTGLEVGSVCMNGAYVKANQGETLDQFLAYTEAQVESTFTNFMENKGPFDANEIIIIDIESPVHPKEFNHYLDEPETLEAIVAAFKMRIDVVKSLAPGHPVSLYGVVVPQGKGYEESWAETWQGYQAAGALGLYDDLDYISPVLYHRWGDTDGDREQWTHDSFHQALTKSALLTRTDGVSIPLFPLLSLSVFNGGSVHHHDAPLAEHVDQAVSIVLEYQEVALFGFWTGDDDSAPVGDIPTFFESVSMVPVPDCTCPAD